MFGDVEYYIRNDGWCFVVAKFEGGKEPSGLYRVTSSKRGGWRCDCPAWDFRRPSCKHVRMVVAWLEMGSPWMKDMADDV